METDGPRRIRDDEGYLTTLGRQVGQARFEKFTRGHATLQAMAFYLVMAMTATASCDYSDAFIDALIIDANDVRKAASEWADDCIAVAEAWRAQRHLAEKDQP